MIHGTYRSMRSVIRWYLYLLFTCHLWCASHSAYFIWRAAVLGSLPSDHVPLSRQVSVFSWSRFFIVWPSPVVSLIYLFATHLNHPCHGSQFVPSLSLSYHSGSVSAQSPGVLKGIYAPLWFRFSWVFLVHSHRSSAAEPSFSRPIKYTLSREINCYF